MNDFTKYELQSLLWAIEYVRERTNNCGDIMRKIERDINCMIEKYCEHEWEFYISPMGNAVRCNKCNKGIP